MSDSHIWFEWQISKVGYCRWEDLKSGRGYGVIGYTDNEVKQELRQDDRYLVADGDFEKAPAMAACSPLEATGLFRDFATLDPTDDAILGFANRYGMLTNGRLHISCDDSGDDDDDADFPGEPLSLWIEEIARMNFLLRFWQLVQISDKRGLEQYIRWTDVFGHRGFRFDDRFGAFTTRDILGAPWLERVVRQRDLLFAARFMLDSLVTEQLGGRIGAVLIRDSLERASLRFGPQDLRTALWLQFARAIEGGKEYQQCEHCRMWYEIGSREGARSDKKFCSPACRARHWRELKTPAKKSDPKSPRSNRRRP